MIIKLIFPKKKVSNNIVWLTPRKGYEYPKNGEMYHNCFGFLIKFKGQNIAYAPFANGAFVKVDNAVGVRINYDFYYAGSFFVLCRLLMSAYTERCRFGDKNGKT